MLTVHVIHVMATWISRDVLHIALVHLFYQCLTLLHGTAFVECREEGRIGPRSSSGHKPACVLDGVAAMLHPVLVERAARDARLTRKQTQAGIVHGISGLERLAVLLGRAVVVDEGGVGVLLWRDFSLITHNGPDGVEVGVHVLAVVGVTEVVPILVNCEIDDHLAAAGSHFIHTMHEKVLPVLFGLLRKDLLLLVIGLRVVQRGGDVARLGVEPVHGCETHAEVDVVVG